MDPATFSMEPDVAVEAVAPLATQVGGHRDASKAEKGMLHWQVGDAMVRVLKPLGEGGTRSVRELAFYRRVFPEVTVPTHLDGLTPPPTPLALAIAAIPAGPVGLLPLEAVELLRGLRALVPTFYGVVHVPVAPDLPQHHFLCLEDLCRGHALPCVADLKLGTRTYDPRAAPEKVAKETAKYAWQAQLGFRVTGMQVSRRGAGAGAGAGAGVAVARFDRFFGRTLTPETVEAAGLAVFFGADDAHRPADAASRARIAAIVADVRDQLRAMQAWFTRQRHFRFYSSSVLIAYDGAAALDDAAGNAPSARVTDGPEQASPPQVRVRLIDFAHAYGWEEVDTDDGCGVGLATLVAMLDRIHAGLRPLL